MIGCGSSVAQLGHQTGPEPWTPGFEAHNVLTMNLSHSTAKYALPGQQIAFFDDVLRRISAVRVFAARPSPRRCR